MNGTSTRFLRLGVSLSGLVVLGWVLTGQAAKSASRGISLPTDWSHSHVIFTRPSSEDQARVLSNDPRYWQQLYRQGQAQMLTPEASALRADETNVPGGNWPQSLGASAAPGAGNYPAKFSFYTNMANCDSAATPDYVVYATGVAGSSGQASVVAFDNIYSGCAGTVPSVYWAYNTGGQILTSPVLSRDGTQVAFAQTSGGASGQAGLVLLKWKASSTESVGSPLLLTPVANSAYRTCTAPCMTEVFLHDGFGVAVDDRTSSPFYDFSNDVAWVGGTTGWLHKVTNVFLSGTPTEVTTGGFPVQVNSSNPNALASPVYDGVSKNVFVGDAGGFLYRVPSATGTTATKSGQLDFGAGLVESPILDGTNSLLYVFSSSDGSTNCAGVACTAVFQLSTTFAAGSKGSEVTAGTSVASGNTPNAAYIGGFDSTYYGSAGATGDVYVCGNTGGAPTLYRVPIASGTMGAASAIAALTPNGRTPACSPVTDFLNANASPGPTEHAFFSVQNYARPTACGVSGSNGCAMNFITTPWKANTQFNVGQQILVLRTANNTLYISTAILAGTTGATIPTWPPNASNQTVDGTVVWVNQGPTTATALAGWTALHPYGNAARIIDSNNNVEVLPHSGVSGLTVPTWNTTVGGTTVDGTAIWLNAGPWPNAVIPAKSGTGGIIIDNVVSSGTLAGASQVYFFTQASQVCGTSGTGACAVQVSQSSMQ